MLKSKIPLTYNPQKGSFSCFAKRNGRKKVSDNGMLTKMLLAKSTVFSVSAKWAWLNPIAIKLESGSAITNPASAGLV